MREADARVKDLIEDWKVEDKFAANPKLQLLHPPIQSTPDFIRLKQQRKIEAKVAEDLKNQMMEKARRKIQEKSLNAPDALRSQFGNDKDPLSAENLKKLTTKRYYQEAKNDWSAMCKRKQMKEDLAEEASHMAHDIMFGRHKDKQKRQVASADPFA